MSRGPRNEQGRGKRPRPRHGAMRRVCYGRITADGTLAALRQAFRQVPAASTGGGGGGIRTPGAPEGTTVFETAPFDRSGTPPFAQNRRVSTVPFHPPMQVAYRRVPASSAADQQGIGDRCSGARDGLCDLRQAATLAEVPAAPRGITTTLSRHTKNVLGASYPIRRSTFAGQLP